VTIDDPGGPGPQVFNVLAGQARDVWSTPFGEVGTVFSGQGIEMVWVSKLAEPIDENWFSQETADLILVLQGQLKFEFESQGQPDRVLSAGEVLVLPAGLSPALRFDVIPGFCDLLFSMRTGWCAA